MDDKLKRKYMSRDAYARYKAAHPASTPIPPLGEAGIVEIFGRALEDFEKQIEEKKCLDK